MYVGSGNQLIRAGCWNLEWKEEEKSAFKFTNKFNGKNLKKSLELRYIMMEVPSEANVDVENTNIDVELIEEVSPHKEFPSSTKDIPSPKEVPSKQKFVRLPLARVKAMMKMDPDCTVISHDSVFLVTKATEMFIEYLAKEAAKQLQTGKRKTVMKKDVDSAIGAIPHLCFLDGALE